MQLSLHHVVVFAPDLRVARVFYGDVLGLQEDGAAANWIQFDGSNFRLTVFRCDRASEVSSYSLRARGVRVLHSTPNEGPLGRYVAFADPFGTVLELVETRGVEE